MSADDRFVTVKFTLTYTHDVPLSAYPGFLFEEAVQLEVERELGEIIELINFAVEREEAPDAPRLTVERVIEPKFVTPGSASITPTTE